MKKIFLSLAILVSFGLSAFAGDPEVDPRVLASFKKDFSFAKNVRWEVNSEYSKANFVFNEQGLVAFYDNSARLVSIARNILYNQLPISVMKALEERFNSGVFSSIVEVTRDGETHYLVQTEQKGKKIMIEATSTGYLAIIKKRRIK